VEPHENRQPPAEGAARAPDLPGAAGAADVVEMGGQPPRLPWGNARGPTIGIAVAALVAGLLLGFIGGHHQLSTSGRPARAALALTGVQPAAGTAISATGSRCAVQLGHTLQLGAEIVNQSVRTVTLRQLKPVLPMGGLQAIASQWGTCGSLPQPVVGPPPSLAPGATGWLTVIFDVTVRCPQPLPVGFRVSYLQAGRLVTAQLDSFPDLGEVRYDTCRASAAG
jgi:hypothetical protein